MHQLISGSDNLTAVVLEITLVTYDTRTHYNTKGLVGFGKQKAAAYPSPLLHRDRLSSPKSRLSPLNLTCARRISSSSPVPSSPVLAISSVGTHLKSRSTFLEITAVNRSIFQSSYVASNLASLQLTRLQESEDVKKQTVFFLQTADVWSTFSAAEGCRCGPQTADVLASKKQTAPKILDPQPQPKLIDHTLITPRRTEWQFTQIT
ncbi:hypothetical protein LXL04_039150 [Taraxacum kok-saghyz]